MTAIPFFKPAFAGVCLALVAGALMVSCTQGVPQTDHSTAKLASNAPAALSVANEFFDDFTYTSRSDSNLLNFGWIPRSGSGGPGVNCTWTPDNITFSGGILSLKGQITSVKGKGACTGAELDFNQYKMLNGTYAARVLYVDTPDSGSTGAHVNEAAFWAMSDYATTHATNNYSEVDFEYLPCSGWGLTGPWQTMTTWQNDSPSSSVEKDLAGSWAGWHTLSFVVQNGQPVQWYDGNTLLWTATGGSTYTPRSPMQIIPMIWFIDNKVLSTWHTSVDWVYYAKDTVMTGDQVTTQVSALRTQGLARKNTL